MPIQTGIQLYTVRDHAQEDPAGTIRKIAELGYKGVQFAGYYGMKASELKALLDDCGLRAAGSHVGYDLLKDHADAEIEYALELGLDNITIPYLDLPSLKDPGHLETIAAVREKAEKAGLRFCYHNHGHEFQKEDGVYPFDILYGKMPKLSVELDTFWASFAGADPFEIMRRYEGRLLNIHIKDMKENPEERELNANIGEGCLDIRGFLKEADKLGAKWAFVEMDRCDGDSLECAGISCKNLKAMGF